MYSYWYKDCRGKDITGLEAQRYIQTSDIQECMKYSTKEEFKCFEWEHKPTRTRMINIVKLDGRTEIKTNQWN